MARKVLIFVAIPLLLHPVTGGCHEVDAALGHVSYAGLSPHPVAVPSSPRPLAALVKPLLLAVLLSIHGRPAGSERALAALLHQLVEAG